MKGTILIFFLTFAISLGGGYLYYQSQSPAEESLPNLVEKPSDEVVEDDVEPATVSAEGRIFQDLGCLSCHGVSALGLTGGVTGPDLSNAYKNVEGKHGKPLNEYLKEPTSAVMSSVIGGKPLTDEEIESLVQSLKFASEQ